MTSKAFILKLLNNSGINLGIRYCLLFMLLICVVIECETWWCGSTIIENSNKKQQNRENVLLFVEDCDIELEILNKSTHLNQSETQIIVMSRKSLLWLPLSIPWTRLMQVPWLNHRMTFCSKLFLYSVADLLPPYKMLDVCVVAKMGTLTPFGISSWKWRAIIFLGEWT